MSNDNAICFQRGYDAARGLTAKGYPFHPMSASNLRAYNAGFKAGKDSH